VTAGKLEDPARIHADAAWQALRLAVGTRPEIRAQLAAILAERLAHCGFAHPGPLQRGIADRLCGVVRPGLAAATLTAVEVIMHAPLERREAARDMLIAYVAERGPG